MQHLRLPALQVSADRFKPSNGLMFQALHNHCYLFQLQTLQPINARGLMSQVLSIATWDVAVSSI